VVGENRAQAEIEVRAAETGDLDALVAVSLAGARSDLAWAGRDWVPPDSGTARRLWWERLRDERTWVGVAVAGFTRVGCATAWPAPTAVGQGPKLAYLVGPIVDPEWWGEGIGGALLAEALAVLERLRFARVEVGVQAGNRRGRSFLRHAGWEETERLKPRNPTAIVVYGRDLRQEPIENRSQYAA
jgi:GNAT superfamily N-acetyltransferase